MLKLLKTTDFYKTGHIRMYPKDVTHIHSVWVARNGKYSNVPDSTGTIHFGLKYFVQQLDKLVDEVLKETYYGRYLENAVGEYQTFLETSLGQENVDVRHVWDLLVYIHREKKLPIIIKSVAEGKLYPYQTPLVTIENTDERFAWLVNYLETYFSSMMWLPSTSATTSHHLAKMAYHPYQMHDFSYRGMGSNESAVLSGMGHVLFHNGSDTVPAIIAYKELYPEDTRHLGSVPATEHSVMCAYGKDTEDDTYRELLERYPKGIVSIVSDTWDYWRVLTETLPSLKELILARDGKLVVRPDSGLPIDIICGTSDNPQTPAEKGSLRLLYETFGGHEDEDGLIVLNDKIGLIYGDGMNIKTVGEIIEKTKEIGFSPINLVFGIGSYQYQMVTRDSHSHAFKATCAKRNGEWVSLLKDPVTDRSKKSLSGRFDLPYEAYPTWEVPLEKEEV